MPPLTLPETADRHLLLRAAARGLPGDSPRLDAELLLADALGVERLQMLAERAPIAAEVRAGFAARLQRRRRHEPVAQIVGAREFWSLRLRVTPDVLIPRPETETLVELALRHFAESGATPARILDLGTGSGALLLAALSEWPQAMGVGVDQSVAALEVARGNAAQLGLGARADFRRGDWGRELLAAGARFDLILCNPPYVEAGAALMPEVAEHEPAAALFAGADGLDCLRLVLAQLGGLLLADGVGFVEFGLGQGARLRALAPAAGLEARVHPDLSGRARVLELWRAGARGGLASGGGAPR